MITDSIQPTEAVRAARNIRVLPIAHADRRSDRPHRGRRVGVEPVRLTAQLAGAVNEFSTTPIEPRPTAAELTSHAASRGPCGFRQTLQALRCAIERCGLNSAWLYSIQQVIRPAESIGRDMGDRFGGLRVTVIGSRPACRSASRARVVGVCANHFQATNRRRHVLRSRYSEHPRTIRSTWSSASPRSTTGRSSAPATTRSPCSVARQLDRLSGLVHLDGRHRGAASGLRLRPQGAGARAAPKCSS